MQRLIEKQVALPKGLGVALATNEPRQKGTVPQKKCLGQSIEMSSLKLRPLQDRDEESFKSAVAEFASGVPPWEFAFDFDPDASFSSYVTKVNRWSNGIGVPEGFVPNSYLVGVVNDRVVGRLSLRHTLNEFLRSYGGHIGYGVIPSQRGNGYATEMLRQALSICNELGIHQALVSCDVDNIASQKVIERNGGIFDSVTNRADLKVQKRLYWIYPKEQSGTKTRARYSTAGRRTPSS